MSVARCALRGLVTIAVLLLSSPSNAQRRFSVEALLGGAFSFGTTLSVSQDGFPAIEHAASYETRSFELPPYYSIRADSEHKN